MMQHTGLLPPTEPPIERVQDNPLAEPPPLGSVRRIPALDTLRGIAACAVFLTHALEQLSSTYQSVAANLFYAGHFGVVIFFLCSGYIIPRSLERHPSLVSFWIKRAFRLYPLYWVNVGLCAVCGFAGIGWYGQVLAIRPWETITANLTMGQLFLGFPYLNTVYWTLTAELLFYIIYTALVVIGGRDRVLPITVLLLLATNVSEVLAPNSDGLIYLRPLSLIFLGSVFAWWEDHPSPWIVKLSIVALPFLTEPQLSFLTARLLAFLCVGWLVWKAGSHTLPVGAYLGRISYSVYLLHPLVLAVVGVLGNSWWTLSVWMIVTLIGATFTYRWIELPAIAWGHRIAQGVQTECSES
jgi:peptidoglycan/LPS O-acetylase OafA/YrhL